MEECSLDLNYYLEQLDNLFFWWRSDCFFPIDEIDLFRQSESIIL